MGGVEVFELDTTKGGNYMRFNHVPVNLVGANAHRTPHRILQPACEIFPDRKAPRIEDKALSTVAQGLDELVVYFIARLARHVAALGAFRRVYPISALVADLLPVLLVWVDRAFPVAVLRHQSSFISSRGSTPSTSASLRIVRGCARCLPVSRRLIVSKAIPVMRDKSR
jgi:hypothetical protein